MAPNPPLSPLASFAGAAGSRVQRTVESLLLRHLAGRHLLPGNLVVLPVFGQHAVFVVDQVETIPTSADLLATLLPVTAGTQVHLLLGGNAAAPGNRQLHAVDLPGAAAAAAAAALTCAEDDAGALAAARAAAAGLASKGITFDQLGGAFKQVSCRWNFCNACCLVVETS